MKCKMKRKIAVLAVLAVVFQAILGYFPDGFTAEPGKPEIVTTYAAPGDEGEPVPGTPTQGPTSGGAISGTPTPSPTPTPNPWGDGTAPKFYMMVGSEAIKGQVIDLGSHGLDLRVTRDDDGPIPSDVVVEFESYNESIIKVSPVEGSKYRWRITVVGPGCTSLGGRITYQGFDYLFNCQVQVPLKLHEINFDKGINTYHPDDEKHLLGMIKDLKAGEEDKRVVQLIHGDPKYSHFLPIIENVTYLENVNSFSAKADFPNGFIAEEQMPFWDWNSSDTGIVEVDRYGYITTVGAGYAEVTVTLPVTADNTKEQSITIPVLVKPDATPAPGELQGDPIVDGDTIKVVTKENHLILHTNATIAANLEWKLYLGTADNRDKAEVLKLDDNKYMDVSISNIGNGVTLSNIKAGVYTLTAMPTKEYSDSNAKVRKLIIQFTVPIFFNISPVVMNVGDTYDLFRHINVLPESLNQIFNISVRDEGTDKDSGIVEVSKGIVTGKEKGKTKVILTYLKDNDIFHGQTGAGLYKDQYEISVTVIDGIALNMTSATIYIGSELQLHLDTSNNSAPITWVSSDPSVATVEKDSGLVKGLKEGTTTITVTQIIDGVTKTAKCVVRVIGSITSITLDPKEKELAIGDLLTINAQVTPKLNEVSLDWVTSNSSIVSIEQAGDLSATVKAQAGGTAVIMAINKENVVVGSCLIRVKQPIVSIKLSQTKVTIPLSEKTLMLYATISPDAARNEPVIWRSTDTSIATVNQFGQVTLKKAGVVSIMCSAKADGNITAICNITITKSVSSIKLDQKTLNMYVGEAYRLSYVVEPTDAANLAVNWMSTNNTIATVDAKGLVTARGVGQTTIIVKTVDGGIMATCLVTVERVATAVRLDANKLNLNVGDYYYFETTITPADSTDTTLVWETSDKSIAVISNKGKVTAKKAGVAIILAKTKSGSTAYCTVTVQQGVTSLTLSSHEETMKEEEELELIATLKPKNATVQDVKWKSSNNGVATVDNRGRVVAKKEGVTIITCTSVDGGYADYCAIIVEPKDIEITELILNPESIRLGVGKTAKLEATIKPEEATNKTLEWSSSDPDIVTVDKKGRIRGISIGEAVVTCRATDGSGAEAYCEVEVCYEIKEILLNYEYLELIVGHSETLQATIVPANATYGVTWETEDDTIAVVNKQTGRVTGIKAGDTKIIARAQDSGGVTSVCIVHVIDPVPITNIQVSESELVMIPGESRTVGFTILPSNYTDDYIWSSDNPVVASVNEQTGLITANALGTANITIFADSGKSASIKIYVVGLSKTNLVLEQYSSTLISLEVYGAAQSDLDVRWISDNERIAEVAGGRITGRAVGTTTVYAVVNGRRLGCRVTVQKIGSN